MKRLSPSQTVEPDENGQASRSLAPGGQPAHDLPPKAARGNAASRHRRPVRLEGVTYVLGTNRNPCVRNGPLTEVARSEGFEPPTPRFEVWCSIQLSYERPERVQPM